MRLFLVAGLTAGLCASAWAHGPTRQKLELSVDVAAPPAKVWAVIGNFHDLSWVPAVARVTGAGGNDPDTAKRDVTLKSGGAWTAEELSDYDAGKFTYGTFLPHVDVKVLPVADFSAHLSVTATPQGSRVEWRSAFYRGFPNNDPPPELNEAAAVRAVTGFCQPALDGLRTKFGSGH